MAGDENGRNRATMTLPEYEAWLHSMVTGSIHGIWRIAGDFTEREPSKYPLLDNLDEKAIDLAIGAAKDLGHVTGVGAVGGDKVGIREAGLR
ncbi:MAG TPA: hypothetical protein VN047_01385 [Sphingopyxis sp.]|uniref:hypothetical protein n=1 Tax=Sphingopyxis sp. TaxID=1908224 RepID=UPI002C9EE1C1|nr:hypothetical protein [Sphingopyxis sp.]HWW55524.1 hypothetical protein [Sphingopyxis sp.]